MHRAPDPAIHHALASPGAAQISKPGNEQVKNRRLAEEMCERAARKQHVVEQRSSRASRAHDKNWYHTRTLRSAVLHLRRRALHALSLSRASKDCSGSV